MSKPLENQFVFSYTTEDLFLLLDFYLDTLPDNDHDESYSTSRDNAKYEIPGFIDWLAAEDRNKLLK
jgi:hypothetical protein